MWKDSGWFFGDFFGCGLYVVIQIYGPNRSRALGGVRGGEMADTVGVIV